MNEQDITNALKIILKEHFPYDEYHVFRSQEGYNITAIKKLNIPIINSTEELVSLIKPLHNTRNDVKSNDKAEKALTVLNLIKELLK